MTAEDDKLTEDCEIFASRGRAIHEWLDPVLRPSEAAKQAYVFKGRYKDYMDVRSKVLARHKEQKHKNYKPSDVTDISGFQIVRLFNAEVPNALDQLLALLKTNPENARGRVERVREIEFHSSRRLDEPLSIYPEIKSIVEANGYTLKQPQPGAAKKPSSYSSVHILLDCTVGPTKYCSEIQLRSVFEEAWSEISHRLKYGPSKAARGAGGPDWTDDPASAEALAHLDALKSLTDGCAQYADLINRQIQHHVAGPAERTTKPLNPSGKQLVLFERFGKKLFRLVKAAFDRRTDAVNVPFSDQKARAAAFFKAAETFQTAVDAFPEPKDDEDASLLDVLREENAYCSMFSKNQELIARAEETYRELRETRPDRVSVWLRLGQLRRDANDFAEAKDLMEQGLAVLATQTHEDDEAHRQASWLLRRDLAYVCWRIVDFEPKRENAPALLQQAVDHSEDALKYAKSEFQKLNARQNLLYYIFDLWKKSSGKSKSAAAERGKAVLMNDVRPSVDLKKWTIEEIDTIVRAEDAFGERLRAKQAATVVVKRINRALADEVLVRNISHSSAFEALSADERDIFLYSQEVLSRDD